MSSIRVKLIFERPLVKSPEQCWMLVDRNTCKMVRDLEYLIVKKFFVAGHTILNLYLDDFLLPSHEKIDLIRDNDVIRVIEDKNIVSSIKKSGKTDTKDTIETSKKRKHEETSDSKRKVKKAKHSFNNELTVGTNLDSTTLLTDKKSSSNAVVENDLKNTDKSSVINSEKEKSKKNKNSKVGSLAKAKQKKLKKKQPSKEKSFVTKFNDFFGKVAGSRNQWNPTFSAKKSSGQESVMTKVKDKDTNLSETADKGKTQELALTNTVNENNELQPSYSLSKGKSNKEIPNRIQNGTPQRNQGCHIRFDNEENDLPTDALNNSVQPMTHPQVLSLRQTGAPRINGTPNLSPIEPDPQSCFPPKKSVNGSNGKVGNNNQRAGRGGKRKDSYTNRSQIMESTRVNKDSQPQDTQSTTAPTAKKDFSVYPLLHGPPRVGETVAYKMLELSQSYTPEISNYKEGQVISYDPVSKQCTLKLTKESLERVKGDGRVSSKFELFENDEDDDGQATATEEISDEVEIQWTSMVEPRLVCSLAEESRLPLSTGGGNPVRLRKNGLSA